MSAIGSATARGPEMWCDTCGCLGVGSFLEQRRERRVAQSVLGRRVVEHALERIVDPLRFADLFNGASVVAGVAVRSLLGAQDETLDRVKVWEALVALDVAEDGVEQLQRFGGEVDHVRVPRPV